VNCGSCSVSNIHGTASCRSRLPGLHIPLSAGHMNCSAMKWLSHIFSLLILDLSVSHFRSVRRLLQNHLCILTKTTMPYYQNLALKLCTSCITTLITNIQQNTCNQAQFHIRPEAQAPSFDQALVQFSAEFQWYSINMKSVTSHYPRMIWLHATLQLNNTSIHE
jgi:hypothetical protein